MVKTSSFARNLMLSATSVMRIRLANIIPSRIMDVVRKVIPCVASPAWVVVQKDLCFPSTCVGEDHFEEFVNYKERNYFWTMAEPYYGTTVTCGEMTATDLMKQVIDQLYRSTCSSD
eukprot:TRINITY_DN4597_c0_g1_i1.p2 TRINITY_DN4597_c0_g1~~TRINITY_DN4597_c0_g1_i1.p2  ORF type:complete len:117 (+),score=10.50 TRINITY_DN4597_c0_g1_i1:367-717(+)